LFLQNLQVLGKKIKYHFFELVENKFESSGSGLVDKKNKNWQFAHRISGALSYSPR